MKKKKLLRGAGLLILCLALLPLTVFAAEAETEYTPAMYATFWALVPPIVAIVLALITKEVYSSLFIGILVGGLFYSGFSFEGTLTHIFNDGFVAVLSDAYNVGILVFLVILGAMVSLMNRAGGSAAFGHFAKEKIKTRAGAQLATVALGVLIFIDDYFNCLTVGSVMKPVTDEHKVSRAKLAYLIDATAAPVCIIAPIVFNSMYKLEKSDLIKQKVNFIGTNTLTVPISQQLYKNWYNVRMVTDNENNFKTYNSQVKHLEYLPKLDAEALEQGGYFDCDIVVVGFLNDHKSARLAQIAKEHGVKRVIASQNNPRLDPKDISALREKGIEIFNSFNVQSSVLRALIESPLILQMLTDTEAGLYEATVLNSRYTGRELHTLPFVNNITISRIFRKRKPIDPHGDTIIEYGDHILFTGDRKAAEEVREALRGVN